MIRFGVVRIYRGDYSLYRGHWGILTDHQRTSSAIRKLSQEYNPCGLLSNLDPNRYFWSSIDHIMNNKFFSASAFSFHGILPSKLGVRVYIPSRRSTAPMSQRMSLKSREHREFLQLPRLTFLRARKVNLIEPASHVTMRLKKMP